MPEPIPEEAVREATEAYSCAWTSGVSGHETLVRIVLEAASPSIAEHERADERHQIAEGVRALAAKCRAIPDEGLTMGERWQRDEQARDYDRIADMIEKEDHA